MPMISPLRHLQRVYCAGPLFNPPERLEMEQIAAALQAAGFDTFVPHADGMEFAEVHPWLARQGFDAAAAGQLLHEAVFALDVYQVVSGCGSLVLNLNGRVPDEGAVAEAAIAWTLGKPLVILKSDCRSMVSGRDNPLVVGLAGFETVKSIDQLAAALQERLDQLDVDSAHEVPCPANLIVPLERGRLLSEQLAALGNERPVEPVAQIILELFGEPRPLAVSGE